METAGIGAENDDWIRQIAAIAFVFGLLGWAMWKLRGRGASIATSVRASTEPGRIQRNGFSAYLSHFTAGLWFRSKSTNTTGLQSLERLALTPQHTLHVVRAGNRELVIATYPQGCCLLLEGGAGGLSPTTIGHSATVDSSPNAGSNTDAPSGSAAEGFPRHFPANSPADTKDLPSRANRVLKAHA